MLTAQEQAILRVDANRLAESLYPQIQGIHHRDGNSEPERVEILEFFEQEVLSCLSERVTAQRVEDAHAIRERYV